MQEASAGNYDLIVMGHRGANNSIRGDSGLLGSVAVKVINHAPCSVFVVRPNSEVFDYSEEMELDTAPVD